MTFKKIVRVDGRTIEWKEIGLNTMNWIDSAQDRGICRLTEVKDRPTRGYKLGRQ